MKITKSLVWLLLALAVFLSSYSCFSQSTDAALITQMTAVRNETGSAQNTAIRVGDALLELVKSKVNLNNNSTISVTGTDAYSGTVTPAISSYQVGTKVYIIIGTTNTGASTINLNSLGAKTIKKDGVTNLSAGDLPAGSIRCIIYDGTYFQLVGSGQGLPSMLGNSGKFLTNNGTSASWSAVSTNIKTVNGTTLLGSGDLGTITVPYGGTGATTLTGILVGNGTSAVTAVTGTALQVLRRNAGDTAYEFATISTGITNSSTTNEMPKTDGSGNLVSSGIFSATAGNEELGTGLTGASRNILATGTAGTVSLNIKVKGSAANFALLGGNDSDLAFYYYDGTNGRHAFNNRQNFITPQKLVHLRDDRADVSVTTIYPLRITGNSLHASLGTGIGTGLELEARTSTGGNFEVGGTIEAVTTDVTGGSEDFDLVFKTMTAGATSTEKMRIASDGLTTIDHLDAINTSDTGSPFAAVRINRTLSTGASNGHGFRDQTIFLRSTYAYAPFDAAVTMGDGTAINLDHQVSFQSRPTFNSSGTLNNSYGFWSEFTLAGGGVVTDRYASYFKNPSGTGTIDNNYGLYIEDQTKGTANWSIYSGSATSRFGGNIWIGGASQRTYLGANPKLQVEGTTGATSMVSNIRNSNDANPAYLVLGKSRGTTEGSGTVVSNNDVVGIFDYAGHDGTALITAASIQGQIDGTPGTNDMPGRLVFFTTPDGSATSLTRLTITSTGNLDVESGKMLFDATETAGGTTGNRTINKPSGSVNIAAAGTAVTVTNSYCTTSSHVFTQIETNDTTAYIKNVVPGSGTFTINLGVAATAEVRVSFWVIN